YSSAAGTFAVSGAVQAAWIAQGWEAGPLGYPASGLICGLRDGACRQTFEGGTVVSRPSGTFVLTGAVVAAWTSAGGEAGPLGLPSSKFVCGLRDGGCGQVFDGGRIYSSVAGGTRAMHGPIHSAWVAQGYELGPLGYPTSDPHMVSGGTAQDFQGGTLTVDDATGLVTRS
ncbi:hypothetical protein DQ237_07090, partial [Blastococcus sp. TF02-8]|uniref:LGFP repeat-containing protein n=1 Tax=Blastococcus sp. TF02-8 TaxID=2250574 RepID=UPI000E04CB15